MLTQDNQPKNQPQTLDELAANNPANNGDDNGDFFADSQSDDLPLENLIDDIPPNSQIPKPKKWTWRSLSLRSKATTLAVMIGALPILLIGTAGYLIVDSTVRRQVAESQTNASIAAGDKLSRFIFERYGDAKLLANLPIFNDPKVRKLYSTAERSEFLTKYAEIYGVYDSIAVFDLQGNTLVQMRDGKPISNYSDRPYFQEALKTGNAVLNPPVKSKSSGKVSVEIAVPIKDTETNQIIGALRTRIPVSFIQDLLASIDRGGSYHVVDTKGIIFISQTKDYVGKPVTEVFKEIEKSEGNKPAYSVLSQEINTSINK